MKTIKLILKGILLYTTIMVIILYVCGVESLYDNGYFFITTSIIVVLVYACCKTITQEEINILSGNKLLDKTPEDEL